MKIEPERLKIVNTGTMLEHCEECPACIELRRGPTELP
jgi:hypothetical protein